MVASGGRMALFVLLYVILKGLRFLVIKKISKSGLKQNVEEPDVTWFSDQLYLIVIALLLRAWILRVVMFEYEVYNLRTM